MSGKELEGYCGNIWASDIRCRKDGVSHSQLMISLMVSCCKDDRTAGRTKGIRHTCPEPLKGRGEARYFAPKGTQGKGGVGRKSKAEELSAEDSPGSNRRARPEVRGAQDEGNKSGIR